MTDQEADALVRALAPGACLDCDGGLQATGKGFPVGRPSVEGGYRFPTARVQVQTASVSGALPHEVIERIVRLNVGRYRLCYEEGLRRDPTLVGQMTVRLTIDKKGTVQNAIQVAGSIKDPVASCVVRGFTNLSFPSPSSGIVIANVPVAFSASY